MAGSIDGIIQAREYITVLINTEGEPTTLSFITALLTTIRVHSREERCYSSALELPLDLHAEEVFVCPYRK